LLLLKPWSANEYFKNAPADPRQFFADPSCPRTIVWQSLSYIGLSMAFQSLGPAIVKQ